MYFLVGFLLFCTLFLFLFVLFRKRKACKILCQMSCEEKLDTLSGLITPFGYCYVPSQDIFSTRVDAPQRVFGYTAYYDRYAANFGMVFDCLPVYFDYSGKTWLIEIWKGQYGINLGCEAGIYKADSLVATVNRKTALFQAAEDSEMLSMSVHLYREGKECAHLRGRHWWLTAFKMGCYSQPQDLSVKVNITFPNREMLDAFADALGEHKNVSFCVCGMQVQILFNICTSCTLSSWRRLVCRFIQLKNRLSCRLFLWITKPFRSSMDRLLCLYFCLPSFFRRIFRGKKRGNCCRKSCRKCNCKERKSR